MFKIYENQLIEDDTLKQAIINTPTLYKFFKSDFANIPDSYCNAIKPINKGS